MSAVETVDCATMSAPVDGTPQRLQKQIEFILEIDRLKNVLRRTKLTDGSRRENSAEHSWHLALMGLVLAEWSDDGVDVHKVLEMLLIHDVVEIDAGDTFIYDEGANVGKAERERIAAKRLFGLLPADQADKLIELWEEFEARQSPEARLAAAVDRMQPLLSNLMTGGYSWKKYGVEHAQVVDRTRSIEDASTQLWQYMRSQLEEAVRDGRLDP